MGKQPKRGNLRDPNAGRFNVEHAQELLGMRDSEQVMLRVVVAVDLLCAHVGITDEQVELAYSARIKTQLLEAAESLHSLVGEENDE